MHLNMTNGLYCGTKLPIPNEERPFLFLYKPPAEKLNLRKYIDAGVYVVFILTDLRFVSRGLDRISFLSF